MIPAIWLISTCAQLGVAVLGVLPGAPAPLPDVQGGWWNWLVNVVADRLNRVVGDTTPAFVITGAELSM
jgi:hypothetical protein